MKYVNAVVILKRIDGLKENHNVIIVKNLDTCKKIVGSKISSKQMFQEKKMKNMECFMQVVKWQLRIRVILGCWIVVVATT